MSFNIYPIKIKLDTNIPKKEPTFLTKALLYHPLIKKTEAFNEYPYLTLDIEYPTYMLNKLTYEQKVEFFFNKDKMNSLLKRNIKLPEEPTIFQQSSKTTTPNPKINKADINKIIENKRKEIANFNNEDLLVLLQKENAEFIPIHFQNFSNTSPEINTIKDIKTLIQILENKAKLEQNADKNKLQEIYEKSQAYFINKCKEEAKQNIEELKKLYSVDNAENNELLIEEIKKTEEKEKVDIAKIIEDYKTQDYSSYTIFLNNTLEKYETLLLNLKKTKLENIEKKYKDKINKLNENNENVNTPTSNEVSTTNKTENKNEIGKKNILKMIKYLFPTSYPISKNISDSFTSIIKEKINLFDDLEIKDMFPKSFQETLYPDQAQFSYLKIDDKIYTITQIIWVNDIYNHEKYKKLITSYKELGKWKNEEILKINDEINKKQLKFKNDFKQGGTYHFGKEDIEKLEKDRIDPRMDPNLKRQSIYSEKLDIFEKLTKIINYIEELNTYIEIIPTDYNIISDIVNNINTNYINISTKLSTNRELDKKFKELNIQINSITTLEKINDNYISKPGINMNFENDEESIKSILKSKYSKYTNFSASLSEFIKPKMVSTNDELQKTFIEFLDNTDNLQLFNAIMNPKYIQNIGKYLRENEKNTSSITTDDFQKRLDTGISIIDGNESDPQYEIILRIDVILGELNSSIISKIDCSYKGKTLGDTLENLVNAKYINNWELNTIRIDPIDIENEIVNITNKQPINEKKGGNMKYKDTRKLRSEIIKTRKRMLR